MTLSINIHTAQLELSTNIVNNATSQRYEPLTEKWCNIPAFHRKKTSSQ